MRSELKLELSCSRMREPKQYLSASRDDGRRASVSHHDMPQKDALGPR